MCNGGEEGSKAEPHLAHVFGRRSVIFFLRELTQEQEHLDLLTYGEELTFEWKGKQVIYSHTWEVAVLFCIIWFRGSPSSWAWGP